MKIESHKCHKKSFNKSLMAALREILYSVLLPFKAKENIEKHQFLLYC